VLAKVPTK